MVVMRACRALTTLFAHKARPAPLKYKNEDRALALGEETAPKAVVVGAAVAAGFSSLRNIQTIEPTTARVPDDKADYCPGTTR